MKQLAIPLLVLTLIVVNVTVLNRFTTTSKALDEQQTITVKTTNELRGTSKKLQTLTDENSSINSSLTDTRSKMEQLQAENDQLKAKKQAREQAAKEAAELATTVATYTAPRTTSAPMGNATCVSWLAQAGVTDMDSAVRLQARENMSCDPQKYNMGGSDACGVAQELPCGKSGCGMPPNADGACQIRWMAKYVSERYGSWAAALAHSDAVGWY